MRPGLYAVTLSQGFARSVLRVGWFRPSAEDPDELDVVWCTPYRGEYQTRLAQVWVAGPSAAKNWTWSPPVRSVAHRLHVQPLATLDPAKWASVVGEAPRGWM